MVLLVPFVLLVATAGMIVVVMVVAIAAAIIAVVIVAGKPATARFTVK